MKMDVDKIIFRQDLYPRINFDKNKVMDYSENLELMPPVIINQDNILIDGYHRLKAHQIKKIKEIEVVKEKTESENQIYLRAIETNATHGLQLSNKDKRSVAIKLYDGKNAERLRKALSVSERAFRDWTSNKRKEMESERNEKIIDLYLKCRTQQEIADEVGMPRKTVADIIQRFGEKGNIAEIAKTFQPYLYNVWSLGSNDSDNEHFGKFPQKFYENILYYFTKPFEVVYDPFAGGGVTIDCCKKWFRRYYVSDLNPIELRKEEIKKWNVLDGIPKDVPTPNLIFLDPPYWRQAQNKYSKDKQDLGNMEIDEFYKTMQTIIANCKKKLNTGSFVAFVIQPTQWKSDNREFEDHTLKIYSLFEKNGFKERMRFMLPYSTQQYTPQQVEIAKKEKLCMNLLRDLIVFEKI